MRENLMRGGLVVVRGSAIIEELTNEWDVLQGKNVQQKEQRGWADLL